MFSCGFHGWSYGLGGRLKVVPDEESFDCLNKAKLGLTPVRTDVWNGFVFVNLDPEPRETLREYLGEVADRLDSYPFGEYSQSRYGWSMELAANFKIVQNAQQESYHNAFTHPRSLSFSRSKSNPFGHCLHLDIYSKHCFISSEGNLDYKPTPVAAAATQFGAVMGINDAKRLPAGLNPTKSPAWAADGYIIFPNFVLSVNVGMYVVQQFWPLAQDRTLYEVWMGTEAKRTAGERFAEEYGRVFVRDVLMEEMSTVEKSQEVYASGAKRHLVLHDEEIMIRHDLRVRDEYVRRPD
jgi:phenylpropionate dioxygenase-like ring-hydroxylating dioxygenase large terminal subunit